MVAERVVGNKILAVPSTEGTGHQKRLPSALQIAGRADRAVETCLELVLVLTRGSAFPFLGNISSL